MSKPDARGVFKRWEKFAAWSVGLTLVLGSGGFVVRSGVDAAQERLVAEAKIAQQMLAQRLDSSDAVLTSLTSLYQASEELSSTELAALSQPLLSDYPFIATISYLTWVRRSERAAFEVSVRRAGFTQFRIRDYPSTAPGLVESGDREQYLPISFLEPLEPQRARFLGVDLLNEPAMAEAVQLAVGSGEMYGTVSKELSPGEPGYALVKATYFGHFAPGTSEERRQQVSGAFLLVLDVQRMLNDIQDHYPGLGIVLTLGRELADTGSLVLGRREPRSQRGQALLPSLRFNRTLSLHDDRINLEVFSQPSHKDLNLWMALLVMTLTGIFAGSLLYALRNRRLSHLDRQAAQDAIFREKERAEVTLQSIGDGVITADTDGLIQYMNPIAEELTGWSGVAAGGRKFADVVTLLREGKREPVVDPFKHCLERFQPRGDLLLLRRDGHATAVDHRGSSLRDRKGITIGAVLVLRDVSRERQLANELAYQASHDPLTGLSNRWSFETELRGALDSSRMKGVSHALCYLDLDQFKLVNDTCGHSAGDQLLKQTAELLSAQLRDSDLLGRLGGDEFGALLFDCSMSRAEEIAERLRRVLRESRFRWEDKVFEIGVSIGIVPIRHDTGTLGDVQTAADLACYAAKDEGRDCVYVYQPGDEAIAKRHGEMQWHRRITVALDEDRFALYWQVIQPLDPALKPTRIREFLVRMLSPTGEIVPPMAFIPAAERYTLMASIDRWVIENALEVIGNIDADGKYQDLYTINLSGQSMADLELADFVLDRMRSANVLPSRLCFEVTETAAISSFHQAATFIEKLRDAGCLFALDDFGAGLSSFGYLKRLPVDFLKIDGQFVRDITRDPVDLAMLKSINGIGGVLGIRTIAEAVEDQETLDLLKTIGVDYAQGYHIGRPEPVRETLTEKAIKRA